MNDRLYPKKTHPAEAYCSHRYWAYVNKGDDDADKECFCDIDNEICYGKGACTKGEE